MRLSPLVPAVVYALLGQQALACIVAPPDPEPFPIDLTSQSIDAILADDLAGLGLKFVDYRSRLSDVTVGSDGEAPIVVMQYIYQLERGQQYELGALHRLQADKVEAMMTKLNERLPAEVCGDYYAGCNAIDPRPTAEFVRSGGVLKIDLRIAGDDRGPEDRMIVPLAPEPMTVSTCAAP